MENSISDSDSLDDLILQLSKIKRIKSNNLIVKRCVAIAMTHIMIAGKRQFKKLRKPKFKR